VRTIKTRMPPKSRFLCRRRKEPRSMIDGVDIMENITSSSSKTALKVERGQCVSPTEDAEVINLNRLGKRRLASHPTELECFSLVVPISAPVVSSKFQGAYRVMPPCLSWPLNPVNGSARHGFGLC
jgi:hypothetical protein